MKGFQELMAALGTMNAFTRQTVRSQSKTLSIIKLQAATRSSNNGRLRKFISLRRTGCTTAL
jgi:hypothetical protein